MKRKTFIVLATLLTVLWVAGCKDKPKQDTRETGFEQTMTNADSVEVTRLVDEFFQYAEAGQVADAAAMLVQNSVDSVYDEPQPLDNEGMQRVRTLLSSFDVKSHHIDYIKFYEAHENEVKCTAVLMEAHDNVPAVTTVFYFKPVNYLGKWKLSLMDSHHGDQTVIDGDKRDSVTSHYEAEMREKHQEQREGNESHTYEK